MYLSLSFTCKFNFVTNKNFFFFRVKPKERMLSCNRAENLLLGKQVLVSEKEKEHIILKIL